MRRYRPVPLDDLVAAARDRRMAPGSVAVTFDDGYVDNYTEASPILSSLGVPATFFVTTDRLGERYEFWWDLLEDVLLSSDSSLPPTVRVDLPGGPRTFETATAEQRRAAHEAIYHAIVGADADGRDAAIGALTRPGDAARRRMVGDEIRSLASRDGHTVGAHSARHLMLPRQPAAVQRKEIDESRRALEAVVARPVRTFAYPFGAFDEETVSAVRSASFEAAVTCEDALVTNAIDPLRLPRLEVTPDRAADFERWLQDRFGRG